jgi:hypothetical protein
MKAAIHFFRHKALKALFPSCHIRFKLTFNDTFLIMSHNYKIGASPFYWMMQFFQLQVSAVQSVSLFQGEKNKYKPKQT